MGHRLSLPCTTWCTYQDETEDLCAGQEHRVPLSRHDRERVFGQEGEAAWADDYVTTYALHDRLSRLSYVFLGHGEAGGMELTPAEARQLAVELVEVASQLDGADDRPARIRAVRIAAVLTTTLDAAGIGTTEAAAALDMPEREAVMVLADLASQRLEYLHRLAVAAGTRLSDVVAEAEAMEGQ